MGCGMSLVKYLLFIFNLVFALSGLALLVAGILIETETKVYNQFLDGKFNAPPILLIVVGVIVFIIAFYGCCGAIRESHCMVVTFAVFLLAIFILEIVAGAIAFVYSNDTEDVLHNEMERVMNTYYVDTKSKEAMNAIQEALKCCGYNDPKDYHNRTLPGSCCVKDVLTCNLYGDSAVHFTVGCREALIEFVRNSGIILGGVAVGIAFIEIVGIVFALCLANSIKNIERRGRV